jgi:broad specificity phosphatase PhoE
MIKIFFEEHSTTYDDENKLASGWNDVRLSPAGMDQSKQITERFADTHLDAIFTSDLKRSYQTATLAFDFNPKFIFTDWRLRECDYGEYTQTPLTELDGLKMQYLKEPFPDGESYLQAVQRTASFLKDLKAHWDDKVVMVIGDPTTQYALEYLINGKSLEESLQQPWAWQPGWTYEMQ